MLLLYAGSCKAVLAGDLIGAAEVLGDDINEPGNGGRTDQRCGRQFPKQAGIGMPCNGNDTSDITLHGGDAATEDQGDGAIDFIADGEKTVFILKDQFDGKEQLAKAVIIAGNAQAVKEF